MMNKIKSWESDDRKEINVVNKSWESNHNLRSTLLTSLIFNYYIVKCSNGTLNTKRSKNEGISLSYSKSMRTEGGSKGGAEAQEHI